MWISFYFDTFLFLKMLRCSVLLFCAWEIDAYVNLCKCQGFFCDVWFLVKQNEKNVRVVFMHMDDDTNVNVNVFFFYEVLTSNTRTLPSCLCFSV